LAVRRLEIKVRNRIDFETDLKNEIHNAFSAFGLKIPIKRRIDEMLLDYLTIHKKIISPRKRNVLINPELAEKLDKHNKRKEVETIRFRLETGKDVNIFQSKRLFQSQFHDHLLYEWNVFHFHLSLEKDKKSNFVRQTDLLLFAYIDNEEAIFLDIENHKPGIFADEKWLEVIDRHFPEILEKHIHPDIINVYPELKPVDRQKFWDYGYSLGFTKVNGKIIGSPGVGRMTSGHSMLVVKTCNEVLRWLYTLNEHFEKYYKEICESFEINPDDARYKLTFGGETLNLIETTTKKTILTYPNIFNVTLDE
jgi:hypothetical protein